MSWMSIALSISTFITSQFGITICIIAVAIAGGHAALHGHWNKFWSAIGGSAVLMSAAWTINTFMGG